MVALAIFWSALFCLIFFLLGTAIKLLMAAIKGVFDSILEVGILSAMVATVTLVLYLFYCVAYGVRTSGVVNVIISAVVIVLVITMIFRLVGGIGGPILNMLIFYLGIIKDYIILFLMKVQLLFEMAFYHFLLAILNRVDKRLKR